MTPWEMDREWLVVDQSRIPPHYDKFALQAGGYLIGVSAEVEALEGWQGARNERPDLDGVVRVELADWNKTARYGRFIIPIGHGYRKGGILLPEPLPNFNTADPYVLHFIDKPPALRIYTTSCWTNTAEAMRYREEHTWKANA